MNRLFCKTISFLYNNIVVTTSNIYTNIVAPIVLLIVLIVGFPYLFYFIVFKAQLTPIVLVNIISKFILVFFLWGGFSAIVEIMYITYRDDFPKYKQYFKKEDDDE